MSENSTRSNAGYNSFGLAQPARIIGVQFYVRGDQDNQQDSYITVKNREMLKGNIPVDGGICDRHMGVTDENWGECTTCFNDKRSGLCPGHDGDYILNFPVWTYEEYIKWLKIICWNCKRVYHPVDAGNIRPVQIFNSVVKLLSHLKADAAKCHYCGTVHPTIDTANTNITSIAYKYDNDNKINYLTNADAAAILRGITDETVIQLGIHPESHPAKFMLNSIQMPANTLHPDGRRIDNGRVMSSDTTSAMKSIVHANMAIGTAITANTKLDPAINEKLTMLVTRYQNMTMGSNVKTGNKITMSISQRIPDKTGRIRSNLLAKRVPMIGRSVITGNKVCRIDEAIIPSYICQNILVKITMQKCNQEWLMAKYYSGECESFEKKDGKKYMPKYSKTLPEIGDSLNIHLYDGAPILLNRAPSLGRENLMRHYVKSSPYTQSIQFNSSCNKCYNADYDGDEMNVIAVSSPPAIAEAKRLSGQDQMFISLQDSKTKIGAYQDGILSMAEATIQDIPINKHYAMILLGAAETDRILEQFDNLNMRDVISNIIPRVNYISKCSFYQPEFLVYMPIKMSDKDINVVIKNGKLVSGILDSKSIGEGSLGGLFHVIAMNGNFGPEIAINTLYNMQQVGHTFLMYQGSTASMSDVRKPPEIDADIRARRAELIQACEEINQKLFRKEIIPPLGMTVRDIYEQMQLAAQDHGDIFAEPVMKIANYIKNNYVKAAMGGIKGKLTNFMSVVATIPPIRVEGRRLKRVVNERTSVHFRFGDLAPVTGGFLESNFEEGTRVEEMIFLAHEARASLISQAINTAITGDMNRVITKNVENLIINNLYSTSKGTRLVQSVYGGAGVDTRRFVETAFPDMTISDKDFESIYHCKASAFKGFDNKETQAMMDEEFARILKARETFRQHKLTAESRVRKIWVYNDKFNLPVNVDNIILDTIESTNENLRGDAKGAKLLNPREIIEHVNDFIERLPYVFTNPIVLSKRSKIGDRFHVAAIMTTVYCTIALSVANIRKRNITMDMLRVITDRIFNEYQSSLIAYGTPVGVIAAQSICQPFTQFVLDAKHRAAGPGTRTNEIDRSKEILEGKPFHKMKNPSMFLVPAGESRYNEIETKRIANMIEMMPFHKFVKSTEIFFELFGEPSVVEYANDAKFIKEFGSGYKNRPKNLSMWNIRYEFKYDELLSKQMDLETIYVALRKVYPFLHIVYKPDFKEPIVMRCYIQESFFKQGDREKQVLNLLQQINFTIIRGINGIMRAEIVKSSYTQVKEDGRIETKPGFAIETDGSNLEEVLLHPMLDAQESKTDSIQDRFMIFGLVDGYQATMDELALVHKQMASQVHYRILVDEMTAAGITTPITRAGVEKRNVNNKLLAAASMAPVSALQEAAVNHTRNMIEGVSDALMCGMVPRVGTLYNDVILDETVLDNMKSQDVNNLVDEL